MSVLFSAPSPHNLDEIGRGVPYPVFAEEPQRLHLRRDKAIDKLLLLAHDVIHDGHGSPSFLWLCFSAPSSHNPNEIGLGVRLRSFRIRHEEKGIGAADMWERHASDRQGVKNWELHHTANLGRAIRTALRRCRQCEC